MLNILELNKLISMFNFRLIASLSCNFMHIVLTCSIEAALRSTRQLEYLFMCLFYLGEALILHYESHYETIIRFSKRDRHNELMTLSSSSLFLPHSHLNSHHLFSSLSDKLLVTTHLSLSDIIKPSFHIFPPF